MSSTKNEIFGQNLKMLRAGRSQKQMATLLGFRSYQSYQRYEAGNVPSQKRLNAIAGKLNVLAKDLLYSRLKVVPGSGAAPTDVSTEASAPAKTSHELPWTEGTRLDVESWAREAGMPVEQFIMDCVRTLGREYAAEINHKRALLRTIRVSLPEPIVYELEPFELVEEEPEQDTQEAEVSQAYSGLDDLDDAEEQVVEAPAPPVPGAPQDERFMTDSFERWADSLIRSLKKAPKRWSDGRLKHAPAEFLDQLILFFGRVSALSTITAPLHSRCSQLFELAQRHVEPHYQGVDNSPVNQLRELYDGIAYTG
ncbi:MAG: hypothetical protein CMO80_03725 [Verrucomicrobiales bacterium]|nr:hypothetical protein [Verrucomicrobiales bacterium]|tara:strand:+ start:13292 stop:14221 length:930 start_codon:yes stop_codon:yes gene_type:complete